MYTVQKMTRMSLETLERRRLFMSYVVCRDDKNNLCILGCHTLFLKGYSMPYVRGQIKVKVSMGKAAIKARMQGRSFPMYPDLYDLIPIHFKVLELSTLNPKQAVDVYSISV